MNREKFSQAMLVLGEVYNEPITATRMQAYMHALRDLPEPVVLSAIEVAMETCNFFPRPAEIRQIATGNLEEQADTAWGQFLRALRNRTVINLDEHAKEGFYAMGFSAFDVAQLDVKQLANLRQTFRRGYIASRRNERMAKALVPHVAGEIHDGGVKTLVNDVAKKLRAK